ncbi:MAG: BamA/TamA family outer membrane protein [Flavobacteriales bacterium]
MLLFSIFSCSTTKKIQEGNYLLTKNIIKEDGVKLIGGDAYNSIFQKTNKKVFFLFPFGLWFYNSSNKDLQPALEKWYQNDNRTEKGLDSLLIKTDSLNQWINSERTLFFKRITMLRNKFLVRNQELPKLVDSSFTRKSERTLKNYYGFKEGYLDAKITSETKIYPKKKKAKVIYNITKGDPYIIDSLRYFIKDEKIKALYFKHLDQSFLKKGQNFNELHFSKEQDRIVKLMRNNGYYYFQPNNIRMEVDSVNLGDRKLIGILNIIPTKANSVDRYNKVYTVSKVNIISDHSNSKPYDLPKNESIYHRGYDILSHDYLNYKPRVFTDITTIEPNSIYRLQNDILTKNHYNSLKNFQTPNIRYQIDTISKGNYLISNIFLTPQKKYGLDLSFDSFASNYLTIGLSPNLSLLSRNIFGGAENLELSLKLTGGTVADIDNTSGIAMEASIGTKLIFPRFIIPFKNTEGMFSKAANPQTKINLSASWQNNIGIGRISLSNAIDYAWRSSKTISHKLELSNIQYIANINKEVYFDLYTSDRAIRNAQYEDYFAFNPEAEELHSVFGDFIMSMIIIDDQDFKTSSYFDSNTYNDYTDMLQRQRRITEDVLINSSSYTFEYDGLRGNSKNPFYFKGKIEAAGNSLYLLDKAFGFSSLDIPIIYQNSILGVGYAQYLKFDFDLRKYWRLNKKNELVSRLLLGFVYPYGNALSAPFSKTYFAGGSNDIRAWRAYDLGPGESNQGSFSTEELKITANLEWRKKITNDINGALFIDAGNIWATNKYMQSETLFKLNSFYKQLAIGSGFGLRYDMGYDIVLRLDLAYKIHDPNQIQGDRWLNDFSIWKPNFNIGIGYPF